MSTERIELGASFDVLAAKMSNLIISFMNAHPQSFWFIDPVKEDESTKSWTRIEHHVETDTPFPLTLPSYAAFTIASDACKTQMMGGYTGKVRVTGPVVVISAANNKYVLSLSASYEPKIANPYPDVDYDSE